MIDCEMVNTSQFQYNFEDISFQFWIHLISIHFNYNFDRKKNKKKKKFQYLILSRSMLNWVLQPNIHNKIETNFYFAFSCLTLQGFAIVCFS